MRLGCRSYSAKKAGLNAWISGICWICIHWGVLSDMGDWNQQCVDQVQYSRPFVQDDIGWKKEFREMLLVNSKECRMMWDVHIINIV